MLTPRSGSRIYLALRPVDMRKGFDGLAAQVQQVLQQDPFGGQLFLFRSRRGDRLKAVWWDGTGLCQLLRACATDRPSQGRRFRMHTIRMGEDAGCFRRSLRLLCGGWLPHDDGASEGCLALATDVGVAACPTRIRGFPLPRPASSLMRIVECAPQALSGTRWPMDQTNPSSSRATAAVATTERFPRAVSRL
jgi:hypothetical protein